MNPTRPRQAPLAVQPAQLPVQPPVQPSALPPALPSSSTPEAVSDETAVPAEVPTTDEELLDQSLVETFPASDPISPGAGISERPQPPATHRPARKKKR